MADLNTAPTTYDDKNLPIASGLSDMLQKTGKIQNENLGQQVLSGSQVNNLIDVTKLNLPAVNAYSFNTVSNLNDQEKAFLNNQSVNQANQFNTLQNQLLLANLKGNQAVGQQVQNLKSSTGQFFDNTGVNQNNSTVGLSLLNNANNIGDEQVRLNNQELSNQLSQGLNQFQQNQVALQGQALQQSNANKVYDRNVAVDDRTYATNTTGNIQVIGEDGKVKPLLDAKGNAVYSYDKSQKERQYKDVRNDYYTGLFGALYENKQFVVGKDGKPIFTQDGLIKRNNLEANQLANIQSSMNINKLAALQESDIVTSLIANEYTRAQASAKTSAYTDVANAKTNSFSTGSTGDATRENSSFNASDPKLVEKYNLTADDSSALQFKNPNGSSVEDKEKHVNSEAYKNAIAKQISMKSTFGEGYGSLFEISIPLTDPEDPLKTKKFTIVPKDDNGSLTVSAYTFNDNVIKRLDPLNQKVYEGLQKQYVDKVTKSALGESDMLAKLFIDGAATGKGKPAIVGLSSNYGTDAYNPNSQTNFAEIKIGELSESERLEFKDEYFKIVNGENPKNDKESTASQVYNGMIDKWSKKVPGFATRLTANQVIEKLSEPAYIQAGLTNVENQNNRNIVTGLIARNNGGKTGLLVDDSTGKSGVSFKNLSERMRAISNNNDSGDGRGIFDIIGLIPEFSATDFKGVDPKDTSKIVDVYNKMSDNKKLSMRNQLYNLFISSEMKVPADPAKGNAGGDADQDRAINQKKRALANLGIVNNNGTYSRDNSNESYAVIKNLFGYTESLTNATNFDERATRVQQVQAILKTTGLIDTPNGGLTRMLADIFTKKI